MRRKTSHSRRVIGLPETPARDRVFSYPEAADELGVSLATFRRCILPLIECVHLSTRRRGVRASVLEGYKAANTAAPARGNDQ